MNNYKNMGRTLLLILIVISTKTYSQKQEEYIVTETSVKENSNAKSVYSEVSIKVIDPTTKKRLPAFIRVDKVSFDITDTSNGMFLLRKGVHKIQAGWVGFYYSKPFRLKIKNGKDYSITVFLKSQAIVH
jgi:hypothetical protein